MITTKRMIGILFATHFNLKLNVELGNVSQRRLSFAPSLKTCSFDKKKKGVN